MNRELLKGWSQHLGREMELLWFGHAGIPAILFPTSMARYYEVEDFGLIGGLIGSLSFWLIFGLLLGLIFGLILSLNRGGSAVIKHYALRLTLWLNGYTPFKFITFLNTCAKLILLKKVGGGYIFIHRMLLEYFAELNPVQASATATVTQDGEKPLRGRPTS